MKNVTLIRDRTSRAGTFGTLTVDGVTLKSGELPWRDNQPGNSCIPAGTYRLHWHNSPKFGWCYEIMDVPDRTDVLIHKGNWCGDVDQDLHSDVLGCVLLGRTFGEVHHPTGGWSQYGLSGSGEAIKRFHELMNQEEGEITIVDQYLETGAPERTVG